MDYEDWVENKHDWMLENEQAYIEAEYLRDMDEEELAKFEERFSRMMDEGFDPRVGSEYQQWMAEFDYVADDQEAHYH